MRNTRSLKWIAASTAALIALTSLPLGAAETKKDTSRRKAAARQGLSSGELQRLNRLLGSEVVANDGQKVGKMNNLVLDLESGRVLFAVVSGSSGQKVTLPPGVFAGARGDTLRLNISRDRLKSAPKLETDLSREQASQASFVRHVYQAFNQPMWWADSDRAGQGSFNNVHTGGHLIGMNVVNVQDQPMGEVQNAVIDMRAGRILYVVLDPASKLDLGDRLFPLPPSALTEHKNGKWLTVDTDREKLASGPSFQSDQWPAMGDRSFASRVYSHYGKQAYFESRGSSGLTPTGRDSDRSYENENPNEDRNQSDW